MILRFLQSLSFIIVLLFYFCHDVSELRQIMDLHRAPQCAVLLKFSEDIGAGGS